MAIWEIHSKRITDVNFYLREIQALESKKEKMIRRIQQTRSKKKRITNKQLKTVDLLDQQLLAKKKAYLELLDSLER